MKSLVDIMVEKNIRNDTHIEFGTDKEFDHRYCTFFYDNEFKKYKEKNIRLLEIGVNKGGALAVFHEYFSDGEIYGVDHLDLNSSKNCSPYSRIKLFYTDAYNKDFANYLPKFDIIIDDGPHTKDSHLLCLEYYLSKLKKDGVLIIEDISDMKWTEDYIKMVPSNMTYEIVDIRQESNMSDSILFVVRN